MSADVSLARYGDGNATFYFNSFPDIGARNLDNGIVDPAVQFLHLSPLSPEAHDPLTFFAQASDDIGLASLAVYWRRLDLTGGEGSTGWVPLYDDGMHGDGGMLDGRFAGTLEGGFPDGAQVEFYIRGVDLSDGETTLPGSPIFTSPGLPIRNYSLAVGSAKDIAGGLQISEVVAHGIGLIVDEAGEAEDWIEVRNTGELRISLDGLGLAQSTSPDPREVMRFPVGTALAPGEYLIVWADSDITQGPLHAPFKLSDDGELVVLVGTTGMGATAVAGGLEWPAVGKGEAYAVIGVPGASFTRIQPPSPGTQNLLGTGIEVLPADGSGVFEFVFPTAPTRVGTGGGGTGIGWILEMSGSMRPGTWQAIGDGSVGGIERVHRVSPEPGEKRFFRVRDR